MAKNSGRILLRLVWLLLPLSSSYFLSLSLSVSLVFRYCSKRIVVRCSEVCSIDERDHRKLFHATLSANTYHAGDSSEGVLTWDAMTLSAFQKYDCTLARHTAPGEFSGCLHRWRSCCEWFRAISGSLRCTLLERLKESNQSFTVLPNTE